jgi:hypothetical protein
MYSVIAYGTEFALHETHPKNDQNEAKGRHEFGEPHAMFELRAWQISETVRHSDDAQTTKWCVCQSARGHAICAALACAETSRCRAHCHHTVTELA